MNKTIKFSISKIYDGKRLDIFLSKKIDFLTRSNIKKLIEQEKVKVNNLTVKFPSKKIKSNDKIDITIIQKTENEIKPKNIELEVIYEDKDLLIINKPKGMIVHPGSGNFENTLANALAYKYKDNLSNLNGSLRPGIVHRIDKETSGLLVVAKNNMCHSELGKQFSEHSIKRTYLCLVWGVIRPLKGKISTFITRSKKNRQLMTVSDFKGKRAITNYKTLKVFSLKNIPKISLIECELETGRTHQIRVHLKYKNTSILGDNQYGKKNLKFKKVDETFLNNLRDISGQALHAQTLGFIHPSKRKWVNFKKDVPKDFKKMLNFLNKHSG
ncbi:MAG: RluA family pseudouridine synthase [Pseudomonadota bacterium]|nr:RluA family pseudouridine synthase [Pseudomonadota bacterium]